MLLNLNFFGISIPSYTFFILLGYALGFIVVLFRSKKFDIPKENSLVMFIFAGIGAFVGGKMFYIIQYFPKFLELTSTTNYTFGDYFMEAGMVFYGGMFGVILFILLFCFIFKYPFWKYIDLMLPSLPLTQAFGRIGCLFAGCCYGMPFTPGICLNDSAFAPHGVELFPIQLVESACVFILFIFMLIRQKKPRGKSDTLGIYFFSYGIIRFILEFFRGDELRGHLLSLSTSQWVSIFVIILGIFFLFIYGKKERDTIKAKA